MRIGKLVHSQAANLQRLFQLRQLCHADFIWLHDLHVCTQLLNLPRTVTVHLQPSVTFLDLLATACENLVSYIEHWWDYLSHSVLLCMMPALENIGLLVAVIFPLPAYLCGYLAILFLTSDRRLGVKLNGGSCIIENWRFGPVSAAFITYLILSLRFD